MTAFLSRLAPAFLGGGLVPRRPRPMMGHVNESDATYQTAGNAAFVALDTLKSVSTVPNVMTDIPIRMHGGLLLIDVSITMAHTSTGSGSAINIYIDGRPIADYLGQTNDATSGVCNRQTEVSSGSGQAMFHGVVPLRPGLHRVTLYARQWSGGGNTIFVLMNPRGGNGNNGYVNISLLELNPAYGRAMINQGNSHLPSVNVPSGVWWYPQHPKSALIALASESDDGTCTGTTSTSWITFSSIHANPNLMTRRFWSSGGWFYVAIHATFSSSVVGGIGFMDIAVDGRRISGNNNGLEGRTQVASGNLTLAHVGPVPYVSAADDGTVYPAGLGAVVSPASLSAPGYAFRIPRGWHTAELMVRTNGNNCVFNMMDASGGATNDGWTVMVLAEMWQPGL